MKQTAVEFLIKAFQGAYGDKVINVVSVQVQEAKAMEKEQIIDAYRKGFISDDIKLADDYYNENFNKETI